MFFCVCQRCRAGWLAIDQRRDWAIARLKLARRGFLSLRSPVRPFRLVRSGRPGNRDGSAIQARKVPRESSVRRAGRPALPWSGRQHRWIGIRAFFAGRPFWRASATPARWPGTRCPRSDALVAKCGGEGQGVPVGGRSFGTGPSRSLSLGRRVFMAWGWDSFGATGSDPTAHEPACCAQFAGPRCGEADTVLSHSSGVVLMGARVQLLARESRRWGGKGSWSDDEPASQQGNRCRCATDPPLPHGSRVPRPPPHGTQHNSAPNRKCPSSPCASHGGSLNSA